MEMKGSIHCFTDHYGRVDYIALTGRNGLFAVNHYKKIKGKRIGFYDRDLFEHMAYAIRCRFICDDK